MSQKIAAHQHHSGSLKSQLVALFSETVVCEGDWIEYMQDKVQ